jgi:DNA-binding LytR/AlgR family response regulator
MELHLKQAEKQVSEILDRQDLPYELHLFHDAETLLTQIEFQEIKPDIAVLDIEMDGEDGISLAGKLNTMIPQCRIIFLTSYIDYASDVYEAEHIWFIVKNNAGKYFSAALDKAIGSLKEDMVSVIIVRDKGSSIAVPLSDILYITKVARKALIHCTEKDYADTRRPSILIPEHLKDRFIQCHQGYWVNIRKIRELDHDEFILTDGTRIPISRTFRDRARKQFFAAFMK